MQKVVFLLGLLLLTNLLMAQQTVGLFQYDAAAFPGYSLFAPMSSTTTYLMDNCGQLVHTWPNDARPGSSVYLQNDGLLLRTERVGSSVFQSGGIGGRVERIDWSGNLVWGLDYASVDYHQHHDVEVLPNGNVLILAWERKTNAEAIAEGRDPASMTFGLWPEHIVEVQPVGMAGGISVWEWHLWDHLIQDFDSTKANFGVVADHPELVDVNFANQSAQADWIHANSVAYNPVLDQIILNSRVFGEFWVIDHSTTTAEAASHAGGNSGRGGDLLYRWGNPRSYQRGTLADQQLFGQHDVHWIPDSLPGGGHIILFNNGVGRPAGFYSTVEVLAPPVDSQGNYPIAPGQAYGPDSTSWKYTAPVPQTFFSNSISGASRMPNGNTLICSGQTGTFFEVDSLGQQVWEYVSPVGTNGPVSQGDLAFGNNVFRVERYAADFPGLQGQVLVPGNRIEQDPLPLPPICDPNGLPAGEALQLSAGPNPFVDVLALDQAGPVPLQVGIYNMQGMQVAALEVGNETQRIATAHWPAGVYLLRVSGAQVRFRKLVKMR